MILPRKNHPQASAGPTPVMSLAGPEEPASTSPDTGRSSAPSQEYDGGAGVVATMRAIVVAQFGPPSVLTLGDVPEPAAGPGQVVVRVAGAGVGPWDAKARQGMFGPRPFPFVPGAEVSGTVEEVGEGVDGLVPGDAVYGSPSLSGGYAERSAVAASRLAAAPAGLDLVDAAAVPIGAATALEGLDDHLGLSGGQRLLVSGAAGGVGTFVVQLAKARGASVVATASPANHDFLRGIGADEVLDYHGDWVAQAGPVDAAYDCVGGPTWSLCVAAVRDGGRAVTILPGSPLDDTGRVRVSTFSATVTAARLEEAARLIAGGRLRVEIAARLPLEEAARAHEMVETGHTRGKIVLVVGR
ncbi:MAG: NADP-dependent oxidoreductase [Actinobacteria bacterium]|nr:NADP-dependent oxidoreductase [Actinomycetota bacterium]